MGYVIPFADLESFYDDPGEYGWILEAYKHGLEHISLIITDTLPGGGPPLHTHSCEEAVIIPTGATMRYRINDAIMDVVGPSVVHIPAGAIHAFVNTGGERVSIVCVFADRAFWDGYQEYGPNPLIVPSGPR